MSGQQQTSMASNQVTLLSITQYYLHILVTIIIIILLITYWNVVSLAVTKVDFSVTLITLLLTVLNKQDLHNQLTWSWDAVNRQLFMSVLQSS